MATICFTGYSRALPISGSTSKAWLAHVTYIENPQSSIVSVDYFTSSVKPILATRGKISKEAQDSYVRALKATKVAVHYGRHSLEPAKAPRFIDRKTGASRQDKVDIWKLEEKETDVHIAISMYRTATKQAALEVHDRIEQLVLVSSDTDMTPALKAIREDFPDITIGVILPHRAELNCPSPGSLKEHSHWMRRVISAEELRSHQFPDKVPTRKRPAIKPDYW